MNRASGNRASVAGFAAFAGGSDGFEHFEQQIPELGHRGDFEPLVGRMHAAQRRAEGNHLQFGVFLEEQAALQSGMDRTHLGLRTEQAFVGADGLFEQYGLRVGRPARITVGMGDVGTGKTHMASALCALACERRLEARFFTASSLVMRLRRARDDGRLDREAAIIGKARLLVIDELGFLPLDADGARLLFQVLADAYERQSVVFTTNLEFSRCGRCSGTTRWPPP